MLPDTSVMGAMMRDAPTQVVRLVDDAHAALAEHFHDAEVREGLTARVSVRPERRIFNVRLKAK